MEKIVVIGGGGHAKVVIEVLQAGGWSVKGFCDPSWPVGDCLAMFHVSGDDSVLPEILSGGVGMQSLRWVITTCAVELRRRLVRRDLILSTQFTQRHRFLPRSRWDMALQ